MRIPFNKTVLFATNLVKEPRNLENISDESYYPNRSTRPRHSVSVRDRSLRHAHGVASPLPRHSTPQGSPTFGTSVMMGCGGLGKSAQLRLRTGYIWSNFFVLLLLPACVLRRGPHEVLGAFGFTSPAPYLGGSNATRMKLEARPWLVGFTPPHSTFFRFFFSGL